MVIGEDAFIDRDTRIDFQRSGTYHILVVSGMNVTILAFVVFCVLRRLRLGDVPATLLTILFCVAYAFLTEVGSPVWRATLMCAIYLGTRLLYRDRAMVNALGTAALGIARIRSPAALRRQFSDDVSLRADRGRHRTAAHGAHFAALPPGPCALGHRRLRPIAASASRTVPPGSPLARRTPRPLSRPAAVAAPGAWHVDCLLPYL